MQIEPRLPETRRRCKHPPVTPPRPPIPTPDEVRAALREARAAPARPARSAAMVLLCAALCLGPLALAPHITGPLRGLLALPEALGLLMAFVVVHEAAHGSLLGRRLDPIVGTLFGLLALVPFGAYRRGHAAHHRYSGTARDPAPPPPGAVAPSALLTGLMRLRLLPVFYWGGVYGKYLTYDLRPTAGPRRTAHIARSLAEITAALTLWLALDRLRPGALPILALGWLGAGVLYEHLFTFTQHLGLRPAGPPDVGDRYSGRSQTHFARTVRLPLSALVFHFNLHKEHHLAPGLSWQRLPALNRALARLRPETHAFTDDRIRPWHRHRGPAHRVMSATVGEPRP